MEDVWHRSAGRRQPYQEEPQGMREVIRKQMPGGRVGAAPARAPVRELGASLNRACACRLLILSGAEAFRGGL